MKDSGTCITAEMRKDRTPLEQMKRRAQEAEGELSILRGIETNRRVAEHRGGQVPTARGPAGLARAGRFRHRD